LKHRTQNVPKSIPLESTIYKEYRVFYDDISDEEWKENPKEAFHNSMDIIFNEVLKAKIQNDLYLYAISEDKYAKSFDDPIPKKFTNYKVVLSEKQENGMPIFTLPIAKNVKQKNLNYVLAVITIFIFARKKYDNDTIPLDKTIRTSLPIYISRAKEIGLIKE